jgi:phage-related minor tail protein
MADPRTNLKVSIGAELGEIKSALASLRGDLKQTQKAASGVDLKGITSGLKGFLGAVGGLGAVTLGIRAIANATIEAEKAQAQLNAVLKSTGGAAGLSAGELNKMADSLQAITTFDDEAITGAQSLLLTFTNVGRDVFPDATKAILDMSVAMGQDLKSSTVQVGKALNDPIAGITALTRVGVTFTQAQKRPDQESGRYRQRR